MSFIMHAIEHFIVVVP